MGLYPKPLRYYLNPGYGFPTEYFAHFSEFDMAFGEFGTAFEDFAYAGIMLELGDPAAIRIAHSFWRAWLEARALMEISSGEGAGIAINAERDGQCSVYSIAKEDDRLQLFRIYLRDVCPIPRVDSLSDLVRLHNHKYLKRFRQQLEEWRWSLLGGDARAVVRMKRDFELAGRDLRRVATLEKVGGIFTIIALPVAIAGLLCGIPLDFGFTALGPGLVAYSKALEEKASWIRFGGL
jgi:hypothetical protein